MWQRDTGFTLCTCTLRKHICPIGYTQLNLYAKTFIYGVLLLTKYVPPPPRPPTRLSQKKEVEKTKN